MSVPKKRRTLASKKRRASHFSLSKKNLSECPKCKKPVVPHHACAFCGTYAGRQALKVKAVPKASSKTKKETK